MLRQYFYYDKMHSLKTIQSHNLRPYLLLFEIWHSCRKPTLYMEHSMNMEWTYICRLTWCYKCHYTNDGITNCEYGPENSDGFWVPDVFCRVEMRCVHVFDLCAHFGRSNLDRLKEEKNIRKEQKNKPLLAEFLLFVI